MSHTPGPWTVGEETGYPDFIEEYPRVLVIRESATDDELRLLAAAPDLLAACEVAMEYLGELVGVDYDCTGELAMIVAAIDKARGRS